MASTQPKDTKDTKNPSPAQNKTPVSVTELIGNSIKDVIWLYNLILKQFEYISPSITELRGISVEDAMKEDFSKSLHEDDYQFIISALQPRIERFEDGDESMKSVTGEFRQIHKNGTIVWVEITTTLIKNELGKVWAISGVSREITKKKKRSNHFQDTLSLFETVFNYTGTGIAMITEEGSFINVNSGFCKMLGFTKSYVMERSFYEFVVPGDESCVKEIFDSTRTEKNFEKQSEIRLLNLTGDIIWGILNITGIFSKSENRIQWVLQIQETTARKKAEETIKELYSDLKQKNREMEQLVYVTSHDLRSPLVNIKGFGGELQVSFNQLKSLIHEYLPRTGLAEISAIEEEINESFEYINVSVDKMDRLLKGLLDYSRLDKKGETTELVSMNNLVADVLKTNEYLLKSEGIEVSVERLFDCYASEPLMNQAISNLIGNAIKYLDKSRPGKIKIFGGKNEKNAWYCIEDNGIGISKTHQEKVFELFYRYDPDLGEGEGLGLSTVKKIMEIHGGKIVLESMENMGSRFFLYLPNIEKADIG
jgi:PAS domain S-box-containing protein